ncbi:MAG: hypothetical protein CL816_00265 [Coxiellaceae bacterium]|nr:hypothetical protein [Coxiellaceae bacterium]
MSLLFVMTLKSLSKKMIGYSQLFTELLNIYRTLKIIETLKNLYRQVLINKNYIKHIDVATQL